MGEQIDLPDEIYGFGSWLLWLLATRATDAVDKAFEAGPARPSRHYGMVDGHPVPTPSLVAWILAAAEFGVPLDQLAERDRTVDERQKVLRTTVSRAIGGEPHLFKESWLRDLAAVCSLGEPELQMLFRSRDDPGHPVDPQTLRKAIAQSFRSRSAGEGTRLWAGGVAAARTLPRDVASFTGRDLELQMLMKAMQNAPAGSAGVVAIYAIGGMAGVGKTAFAVHAAHLLAQRFPDGQVFLPLHGHSPGQHPVDPADALASLLLTAGVSAQQIPPGLQARMALWRDHLAARQLLLVLDDAIGHDQVQPLLPGTGGSVVLITSRRHLTALEDAQLIGLDSLAPDQAARLLVRLTGRPGLEPDVPAVAEIAALCGYLPLAIGMVARQLHHHPAWGPAELAADLATARNRLELMQTENVSVAAAFDLSYQDLTRDQQRLFRHLGRHLGTDIDAYAAAAVDGTDLPATRRNLDALYEQYLLAEPARGRYRLHDLLREHARALAVPSLTDHEDAALNRLLGYYLQAAALAESRMARQTRAAPTMAATAPVFAVPDMPDDKCAQSWARAERANLFAYLNHVTATSQHAHVVTLTTSLSALLRQDGPWADAIARHKTAVQAARQIGDQRSQANALYDLGSVQRLAGDYHDAAGALDSALSLFREVGDLQGEGNVLSGLGSVRYLTGDYSGASEALAPALGIFRELGDWLGRSNALSVQGAVRYQTGDYQGAAEAEEEALAICRDVGNLQGQANALNHLGSIRRQTGDYSAAAEALEQARDIYGDLDDRLGRANALSFLGAVRQLSGDYQGAVGALEEALDNFRSLGHRSGQANCLCFLGVVRRTTGDYPGAADALESSLSILRQLGDRGGQAEALNELGTLHRVRADPEQAMEYHREALNLSRTIESSWDEAQALAGMGRCAAASGRPAEAETSLRQALEIFQKIGAAEVTGVAAELSVLTEPEPVPECRSGTTSGSLKADTV